MRLTIDVPWLTYSRRLWVMLTALLLLLAMALPASAAPPDGAGGVTVVNEATDPVPITGGVTADVTGSVDVSGAVTVDNEATDPVPISGNVNAAVSGSVGATQNGTWTVGLDPEVESHLSDIDAATGGLTYDASGNLNVAVAGGSEAAQLSDFGIRIRDYVVTAGVVHYPLVLGQPYAITSISVWATGNVWVELETPSQNTYAVQVGGNQTFTQTFPFPIEADAVAVESRTGFDVTVSVAVSGYGPLPGS